MPNGKGNFDCSVCLFSEPKLAGHKPRFCHFHKEEIPIPDDRMDLLICKNLQPSEYFVKNYSPTAMEKFKDFSSEFKGDTLYGYSYTNLGEIKVVKVFGSKEP